MNKDTEAAIEMCRALTESNSEGWMSYMKRIHTLQCLIETLPSFRGKLNRLTLAREFDRTVIEQTIHPL